KGQPPVALGTHAGRKRFLARFALGEQRARVELARLQLLADRRALRLARLAHGLAELTLAGTRRLELLLLRLIERQRVDHALGYQADAGDHDAVAHRLEMMM